MSSGLCPRSGTASVPPCARAAPARKRPAAAPSVTPTVHTFAGRSTAKKSDEWIVRFNTIVTGYNEEKALHKTKGIKFEMTQRAYWDKVVHRWSGFIVCLPV